MITKNKGENVMANKRKSINSIAEKITKAKTAIEEKEQSLKDLKNRLKELEYEKKQMEIEELHNLIMESGKSIEEIKNIISGE